MIPDPKPMMSADDKSAEDASMGERMRAPKTEAIVRAMFSVFAPGADARMITERPDPRPSPYAAVLRVALVTASTRDA
jgi:hypothetical protein